MPTEFPTDTLPVWMGLAVASTALCGVVLGLPTGAPNAAEPARTVDEVAASSYDATTTVRFATTTRFELGTHGLDRCHAGSCAHATFAFGPVTPVAAGSPLAAVLGGRPPEEVFDSSTEFGRVATEARSNAPVVVHATRLTVRHVTWGGVDVTLVGA